MRAARRDRTGFRSRRELKGPGVVLTDVLRATEYVVPAIEIVDARLINPRKIFDTISDNGAAAGIVVGGRPVGPMDVDLRWVGGLMMRNSEIEETGVAAGVLGHPAMGVAWLANKLGTLGTRSSPAIWCSPARSPAWSGRRRATPSAPISARSGVFRCSSCERSIALDHSGDISSRNDGVCRPNRLFVRKATSSEPPEALRRNRDLR